MTKKEAKSCIGTIEMLQRLAYNIHGVMDVIDADNCKKIIKALEQEPILDKIRAEIFAEMQYHSGTGEEVIQAYADGLHNAIRIIDKYKGESEENGTDEE